LACTKVNKFTFPGDITAQTW